MPIDVIDTGNKYKIIAEMSGLTKSVIVINVSPNSISIFGQQETNV
ncbi:MAG: hypothetical protein KKG04_03905 [Candidatus Thermoplasmatota archaeon]|nr:hypothetical protein [Candidatus Thermoplasmatota archaeon]